MSPEPVVGTKDTPTGWTARVLARRNLRWFFLGIVLLYAAGLHTHWRVGRDSALYLCLGRSLAEGQGYVYNHAPHTLVLPGFPMMIAAVMRVFGPDFLPDRVLPLNTMMALAGLGCIGLTYLLLRDLNLPDGMLLAVFLMVAVSRQLYYYSANILSDVPFALLGFLALWAGVRLLRAESSRAFWLWCLCAGLAAMGASTVRPLGPAIAVALVAALWLRGGALRKWKRHVPASLLLGALSVAPLMLWFRRAVGPGLDQETSYANAVLTMHEHSVLKAVTWMLGQVPNLLDALGEAVTGIGISAWGGLALAMFALIGFVKMVRAGRRLCPAFAVVYLLGTCFGGSVGRRYLVPVLPILAWAVAVGLWETAGWLRRKNILTQTTQRRVAAGCLALVLVLNLARVGKVVVENRSPDFYGGLDKGRWARYLDAGSWLNEHADPDDSVALYEMRLIHLLTRLHVVRLPRYSSKAQADAIGQELVENDVRYALMDNRKAKGATAALEVLFRKHPDASEPVFERDGLRMVRVYAEKLAAAGTIDGT